MMTLHGLTLDLARSVEVHLAANVHSVEAPILLPAIHPRVPTHIKSLAEQPW